MRYHDMSEHFCQFPLDPDKCDFQVEIGSLVGFREQYDESYKTDKTVKCYKVIALPNCADMVEMQEISDISVDCSQWTVNPDTPVISVEPWKIGLV